MEMGFQFDIIGLTETKITKTTDNVSFEIPGYTFEYVTTPLVSGGIALLSMKILITQCLKGPFKHCG